jgi:hypothetical protein
MRMSLLLLSMISYNAWMVGNPHLTLFELPKNILCHATNLVISV